MKRDLCKTGVAAFGRKLANEFSNDVTRLALSPGERARVRAGVHLTFQNGNRESYNRSHPGLLPREKEKCSPRFGIADALGCRAVSYTNDQKAGIAMMTNGLSSDVDSHSLSPGERARVRASIHLTFQEGNNVSGHPPAGRTAQLVLTTVLTPALSSRRGRITFRLFEKSRGGIGGRVCRKPEIVIAHLLSPGERARVRAVLQTNFR